MKLSDFRYALPEELIAQYPAQMRGGSRLLCLDARNGRLEHHGFGDLPGMLRAGDLLVFNDTRVLPARLFGCKAGSGGVVEILVERVLDASRALAQIRASKAPKTGSEIILLDEEGCEALRVRILDRDQGFYTIGFPQGHTPLSVMHAIGHLPLPPYIARQDRTEDRTRYQTVYAARDGAVAAPTAGLHFDLDLLRRLQDGGVETGYLTLHVGSGTFQPVRAERIEDHRMHAEYAEIDATLCERIMRAHAEGRRVIAVGTTSLRALESASADEGMRPFQGETSLFIRPGYRFRCVDALITNFHLPESTLLILVCAFAGRERMLEAYRVAVEQRYRFFSYGDAMFLQGEQIPLLKTARAATDG